MEHSDEVIEDGENISKEDEMLEGMKIIPMNQVMKGENVEEMYEAKECEIELVIRKDTWSLVERPNILKVIVKKILLRNKYKSDGMLEKSQGFNKKLRDLVSNWELDFSQTFALVIRIRSVKLIVSLAVRSSMNIRQFNVATLY